MARPKKKGLDYFPFDVDFFEDEKLEIISGEFGIKGENIAIRLLCAIYRNGYFAQWSEQLKYKIARRSNLSPELVHDVVKRLVKWEFFDESLFNSVQVLTSTGIQTRWMEATRKRAKDIESLNYFLIGKKPKSAKKEVSAPKTLVSAPKTPVSGGFSTQSKVNKSKLNNLPPIIPQGDSDEKSTIKTWTVKEFRKALLELGMTEQIANDYIQHRKTKKASFSKTAFNGLKKQIQQSGFSPDECAATVLNRGWTGFKAEWMKNTQGCQKQQQQQLKPFNNRNYEDDF